MMKKILLFFSIFGCYNVAYSMNTSPLEESWSPSIWSKETMAALEALRIIAHGNNQDDHQGILEEGVIPEEISSSTPSSEGTEDNEEEDFMGEKFPLEYAFPSYDDIKADFNPRMS